MMYGPRTRAPGMMQRQSEAPSSSSRKSPLLTSLRFAAIDRHIGCMTDHSRRGDCFWQIHDSVLLNKVDFVLFFQYEDGGWELPDRAYYNPEIQPKGCE